MGNIGVQGEQSTSSEIFTLTKLNQLSVSGVGFAIARTSTGFANVAIPTSTITGSGVANTLTYWDSANTLSSVTLGAGLSLSGGTLTVTAGSGTVTSVSVATANGVSGSVATATTTPAITITLGAITPTSVNSVVFSGSSTPTLAVTGTSTISGANTGDQTITLTGPVTGSGTSSLATTIANSINLPGSPTTTTQTFGTNDTTIATTAFVQAASLGQNFKEACRVATTGVLVGVYLNGVFTYTATGTDVIDGITLVLGDRVLVKNQGANDLQNGIYTVTTAGAIGIAGVLTRATDANQSGEFKTGDSVFITSGTANSATTWAYTGIDSPTIGTTSLTYVQVAGQGSFTGGNGITITGTSIAIDTSVTADLTTSQVFTNKTLTTPVINGLPTGTGVASGATVSTLMARDVNGNANAIAFINGFNSSATAGGTTTLTVANNTNRVLTGSSTQTLVLPVTSTLTIGHTYRITNLSSGLVTVQSSGANAVLVLAPNTVGIFTCVLTSGTTAASWDAEYLAVVTTSGKSLSVLKTLTLDGTDSTTMTFPTTSATIARTDAANTFTGASTATSWVFTTPLLGTPTSGVLTNCTGLPAASVVAGTFGTGSYTMDTQLTVKQIVNTSNAITASANAATVPITSRISTVTNNSAATLTITVTTTSAVDGQMVMVRILDFSAVAQTITWVNTENSGVTIPTTSNGSTTLPLTVGLQFNAGSTKWRCIGFA